MKCTCGGSILQKSVDGVRIRLDGPITFKDGLAKAKCFWCKKEVTLPIELKKGAAISPAAERFIIDPKKH